MIAGWIVLSFLVGFVASSMGRSFLSYLLLSLVLCVILSIFCNDRYGRDISLGIAMIITGLFGFWSVSPINLLSGPLGYLIYQFLFCHQDGMLYASAALLIASIALKLAFILSKRLKFGLFSFLLGIAGVFVGAVALYAAMNAFSGMSTGGIPAEYYQKSMELSGILVLSLEAEFLINKVLSRIIKR